LNSLLQALSGKYLTAGVTVLSCNNFFNSDSYQPKFHPSGFFTRHSSTGRYCWERVL